MGSISIDERILPFEPLLETSVRFSALYLSTISVERQDNPFSKEGFNQTDSYNSRSCYQVGGAVLLSAIVSNTKKIPPGVVFKNSSVRIISPSTRYPSSIF
jgi:hypothetical protein